MNEVEFFIVYDADGNMVGDTDQETARTRYNDEIGNEEFTVRKIVFQIPEQKTIAVELPPTDANVKIG